MKQPSIWKQIKDENASFVAQFSSENEYEKAGLTLKDQMLVVQKRDAKVLHGVTRGPDAQWQVRFTLNGKQEILFACYSLPVAALMRDLLLTMLIKYPHCVANYAKVKLDPAQENAAFNFSRNVRSNYECFGFGPGSKEIMNFLERVEKILLDRGTLYALTLEELAAREQIASQSKTHADSAAQKRYQTRRNTQLDQVFEQVRTIAESSNKLDELRARLFDWMDKKDVAIGIVSDQIEFMTGQFESLKLAVEKNTATFQKLIDEARASK